MPAPGGLVEVGEVRITLFGPAARGPEDLAGEYGEGSRYRDRRRLLTGCLGLGLGSSALPVGASRGGAGARQPVERDVVQDGLTGETARRPPIQERMGDLFVAVGVVVEHPGRQ